MPLKPKFKSGDDAHLLDVTLSDKEEAELRTMQLEALAISNALKSMNRYDSYAARAGFMNAYINATSELRVRAEIRAKKARIQHRKPK